MTITVFSTPACGKCMMTKSTLKRAGLAFEAVEATPEQVSAFAERGATGFPVVVITEGETVVDEWSGHNPNRIAALAADERVLLSA